MWLNGLCCGGLCGVGEVLKGQQQPLDDRQDQEELNPSSDCGTHQEATAVRPHAVMGCTPSILSSNGSGNNQQQKRKDSFGLYSGNVPSAGSGALAESNGANSNKFPSSNTAVNQAQMLGFGQGCGKDAIGGIGDKVHLMATWKALQDVKGNQRSADQSAPSTSKNVPLQRVQKLLSVSKQSKPSAITDIEKKIRRLSLDESLPLDCDVIEWWENQRKNDMDLAELALTVLQLPCTQVSVERAFNGLGQILSKFRTTLGTVPLQQILFLKANNDIVDHTYFDFQ